MSERRSGSVVAVLSMLGVAFVAMPALAAGSQEARVIHEACGDDPEPACVAELRKVCHGKMTMRCYLSRKARIDAKRDEPDSPEQIDERDDRAIFYDE